MARTKPSRVSRSQRLERVLSAKLSGTHSSSLSSASQVKPDKEVRPIVFVDLDTSEELLEEILEEIVDDSSQSSESSTEKNFTENGNENGADSNSDDSLEASNDQEDSPDRKLSTKVNYKAKDGTIKKRYRPGNMIDCCNDFETFF